MIKLQPHWTLYWLSYNSMQRSHKWLNYNSFKNSNNSNGLPKRYPWLSTGIGMNLIDYLVAVNSMLWSYKFKNYYN